MSAVVERKIEGTNQTVLAETLGVNKSHVSMILKGKRKPSLQVAASMAKALGVSLDDFHGFLVERVWVN